MVGIRSFPFGMAHFQLRTVSFWEGNSGKIRVLKWSSRMIKTLGSLIIVVCSLLKVYNHTLREEPKSFINYYGEFIKKTRTFS